MAVSITRVEGTTNGTDAAVYTANTGGHITFVLGDLYILLVAFQDGEATAEVPTSVMSSGSMVWTQVGGTVSSPFDTVASPFKRLTAWWAVGSGAGEVVTITMPDAGLCCGMPLYRVTGADTTDPIVQSDANEGDTGTTASATLAAFDSEDNAGLIFVGTGTNTPTITAEAGWTELTNNITIPTPNWNITGAWRTGTDTSPTMAISAADNWGAIAMEIRAAGAEPEEDPPPPPIITPTPASFSPLVPAGGFGGHTDWPAINPQPAAYQDYTFTPTGSIRDDHISDLSVTKLRGVAIKAYRSTVQSIDNDTITNITYDTVSYRLAFKDPGASFTALTIPYDGVYLVQATVEYDADADGIRNVGFEIDGDGVFHEGARLPATPTGSWRNSPVMVRRFTSGQTIEVITHHTAGAAENINAGEDNNSFSATYLFRL